MGNQWPCWHPPETYSRLGLLFGRRLSLVHPEELPSKEKLPKRWALAALEARNVRSSPGLAVRLSGLCRLCQEVPRLEFGRWSPATTGAASRTQDRAGFPRVGLNPIPKGAQIFSGAFE